MSLTKPSIGDFSTSLRSARNDDVNRLVSLEMTALRNKLHSK